MKKYKVEKPINLIFWSFIVILILIYYIFKFIDASMLKDDIEIKYVVNNTIETKKIRLKAKTKEQLVLKTYEEMSLMSKSLIPNDLDLKSVEVIGKKAVITLTSKYNELEMKDKRMFKNLLVRTLTTIDDIGALKIKVEDEVLVVNELTRDEGFTVEKLDAMDNEKIKFYFADEETAELKEEIRTVKMDEIEDLPKYIVETLLKGPNTKHYISTIPEGTKLNSVKVENGICYVDFSREFIDNQKYGSDGEEFTIYSIVNSLTEVENIEKVQFLIDGKIEAVYSHMEIGKPISKRIKLVEDKN